MTDKTNRDELTPDERIFLQALDSGNADLMISIFGKVNGDLNVEKFLKDEADKAAEPKAETPAEALTEAEKDDLANVTLEFLKAWKTDDITTLQSLVDRKRAPALPASTMARERQRARQTAPEIRFQILSMLEEFHDTVNDTACRIANARYGGDKAGIFEEDAIADELIVALSDYFSIQPKVTQLAEQFRVNWFYDLEWDYSKKTYLALDRTGKVVAATDKRGEPDSWDPKQATVKADDEKDED